MQFYVSLAFLVVFVVSIYFFSYQLQLALARIVHWIGEQIGGYSKVGEESLRRYVFLNRNSLVSKLYWFLNDLVITLDLKLSGVTPFGFLVFWSIVAVVISVLLSVVLGLGFMGVVPLFFISLVLELLLIRVSISEKIEKREACVMDAVDLIIPELRNGVKNAILLHKSNFNPMIINDFNEFDTNVNKRKMSFEDAMLVLSDSLGVLFRDFAQKAISYEASGDIDMLDIFVEIIETNRLRRELRDINNRKYAEIRKDFIISSILMIGYGVYTMLTDEFTRHALTETTWGKFLVIFMIVDTVSVLAFISLIKSKSL